MDHDMNENDLLAPIEMLQPIESVENPETAHPADTRQQTFATNKPGRSSLSTGQTASTKSGSGDVSGCYLTFEPVNEGTLFMTWSHSNIEGALAFVKPGGAVPAFKFRKNGGKSEVCRQMRGGVNAGLKRYYEGWTQFVKLIYEYNGEIELTRFAETSTGTYDSSVLVYRRSADGLVDKLIVGKRYDKNDIDAVAVIPSESTAFDGINSVTRGYFVGIGNRDGAALMF